MQPLSALDAISPAWIHTRHLLLGRRDTRLFFKLAAVAFFAELGGGFSFNTASPGRLGHGLPTALPGVLGMPKGNAGVLLPVLIALAAIGMLIGFAMFYLGSRLQFVLFHAVLRGETQIGTIWRRYGPATWRWIGLKALVALVVIACMAPVALPALLFLLRSLPRHNGGAPATASLFAGMLSLFAVVLLITFLAAIVFVLLRDFGLPSMALEGTPLRETLRRISALFHLEPGQMSLFVLMRFVLAVAGTLTSYLVLFTVGFVAALPLGGVGLGLWAVLHRSTPSGHAMMITGWMVLGAGLVAVLLLAGLALFGYVFTFLQAYAIFFLAGRYPLLAQQLQSAPPVRTSAFPWTPAFYPPPPAM